MLLSQLLLKFKLSIISKNKVIYDDLGTPKWNFRLIKEKLSLIELTKIIFYLFETAFKKIPDYQ